MKILVINCGSSSIKYKLFEKDVVLTSGLIERIGEEGSSILNHDQGIQLMLKQLIDSGKIKSVDEIKIVGHRTVHGGSITKSCLINDEIIKKVEEYSKLAPLHNPVNLKGIYAAKKAMPSTPQVAVFDTSFHQTMPDYAYIYALPYEYYEKYGIRRYGFHGTSHKYVSGKAAKLMKKPLNKLNIITCHLGAGCSIAAIKNGKVVDTSMGLTPLEGLVMGTRSGDIDAGILIHLAREMKMDFKQLDNLLNNESGLKGISGLEKDMRLIWKESKTNKRCKLAIEVFSYRLKKYISAYMGVLGKTDAIVFTGGLGESAYYVRSLALDTLNCYGVLIDNLKNKKTIDGKEGFISKGSSRTKILVIPTDEEKVIAIEAMSLLK